MWAKAKDALGLNLSVLEPTTRDEEMNSLVETWKNLDVSTAGASPGSTSGGVSESEYRLIGPVTPTSTSSDVRLSKSVSKSYKKTCAICLGDMKAGHGALFTAECSHAFHFNCIASSVTHGNRLCPVCRAKWKEIPFLGPPSFEFPHGRGRVNQFNWPQEDGTMTLLRRLRPNSSNMQSCLASLYNISEPSVYNDDESVGFLSEIDSAFEQRSIGKVDIKAYTEFSAIPKMAAEENFSILIHLRAPCAITELGSHGNHDATLTASRPSRAPADLVTVLDISGSMAGTKLALLKRAMGFVIQNLGPSDRLSVVAFSSTARRLFPLRRMTESGKLLSLQAVNSLVSIGGTNIAEGLRKGAKVIEERKEKNAVCSIILLSDGHDTYTFSSSGNGADRQLPDYQSLLPSSLHGSVGCRIPVHAFGFGTDHDSLSLHSIAEASGGTFSFIETECVIQDAFAQCIGGLLSVVAQELIVEVECLHPGMHLAPIRSGSYSSQVTTDGMKGSINVGDLYADEERDFLVSVNVPPEETVLLKIGCSYKDPLSGKAVSLAGEDVQIQRPDFVTERVPSIEVDRERNRLWAAESIAEAREAAERGALSEAVLILETRRAILTKSLAGQSGDRLCVALNAELREMKERMENRQRYENSGRAYVLSGLSCHSWQRATARGSSTDSSSLVHAYQTPSMVDMLQRSQTSSQSPTHPWPPIPPAGFFPSVPDPR